MHNLKKRGTALLLAVILCLGLLPPAQAEENRITIRTAGDLTNLARRCTSDTWSEGVTVVLADDINLAGSGFRTIPVFRGTFDGSGHTISGFTWLDKGSQVGLFRTLQEGATVKDLILDGVVAPGGSQSQVGILSGENFGTIERVTVTGDVTGDTDVGALVGVNGATGVLRECVSQARVTGNSHSGGIAGRNEGRIVGCTNQGEINATGNDAATDTGGIAGRNTGTIQQCVNEATVGYPHTGYNTGGIAGIQNGAVLNCTNRGSILGRKDVGGIVGQFEPYTVLTYGVDPMDRLDQSLSALSALMTQLAGQVNAVSGNAVDDFSAIHRSLTALQNTAHGAGSDFNADTSASCDQVYASVKAINGSMSSLLDEVTAFTRLGNADLTEINRQLSNLRNSLDALADALEYGLSGTGETLFTTLSALDQEYAGLTSELHQISLEINHLESFTEEALQALGNFDLAGVLEAYQKYDIASIDFGGHIRTINTHLKQMGTDLNLLMHTLNTLWEETGGDVSSARASMDKAAKALERAFQSLNGHAKAFSDGSTEALRVVNAQLGVIEDVLQGYLDTLGSKGQQRLDEMDQHLDAISQQVEQMTQGARTSNQQLYTTTTAIIGQLDQARQAIVDLTRPPEKTLEETVSEQAAQSGPGRVSDCRNEGMIQADSNVGGITGIVSPELSLDPEEDLDLDGNKLLVDTTAHLKAILYQCDNRGTVIAKNECVGGILGRAETGAALSCTSMGAVEADGGSYVGGIAGLSRALIRACAAQADLTGDSSVGGIAGEGKDLQDCIAMTCIAGSGERLGAVAGWADGTVSGNYYLQEEVVGIDGIDYAGRTTPLCFEAFSALEGVPEEFLSFHVTFCAGDQVVKTIEVPYGGSLNPEQFPAVPNDGGRYGEWAPFHHSRILRSVTVEAVYEDWVTTISSGGERPILLAEGDFSPNARLEVAERADLTDSSAAAAYDYQIMDGADLPHTVTLRVLTDGLEGRVEVKLLQDGALVPVEASEDGSYLLLTAPASGTLVLISSGTGHILLFGIAAAAAMLLLLLFLCLRKRRQLQKRPVA